MKNKKEEIMQILLDLIVSESMEVRVALKNTLKVLVKLHSK